VIFIRLRQDAPRESAGSFIYDGRYSMRPLLKTKKAFTSTASSVDGLLAFVDSLLVSGVSIPILTLYPFAIPCSVLFLEHGL